MTRSDVVPARGRAASAPPPELLAGVRATLMRRRDFRREQLNGYGLDRTSATRAANDATREVQALVAASARRALQDIELALSRIADGRYGYCRVCGTEIPLAVLEAVPQTSVCLPCLQPTGRPHDADDRTPAAGPARTRRGIPLGHRR